MDAVGVSSSKPKTNAELLIDLGLDQPLPRALPPPPVNSALARNRKNFSFSDYDERLLTGEDIIRAGNTTHNKLRSHSEPKNELTARLADSAKLEKGAAVKENIETDIRVLGSDGSATRVLNGYIRHEPVGLVSVDEHPSSSLLNPTISDTDSFTSEDDVFQRNAGPFRDKKPLLGGKTGGGASRPKRVHFSKGSERVKTMTLNDLDDELGPKIRRGRTWRRRCSFLSKCILANLVGFALALLLWNVVTKPSVLNIFTRRQSSSTRDQLLVCPQLNVKYIANRTADSQEVFKLVDGDSKLIRLGDGVWLFVVPFGYACVDCNNGLAAYRTGGSVKNVELAWIAGVDGKITDFSCGEDVDLDGVADCVVVTAELNSIELVSGARGTRIYRLFGDKNEYGSRQLFLPRWIEDLNGDGVPELIASTLYTAEKEVRFELFRSEIDVEGPSREDKVLRFEAFPLHSVTDAVVSQPIAIWRWLESASFVVAVFQNKLGIFVWNLRDFLRPKLLKVRTIGKPFAFDDPLGMFVDANDDGAPELIACTKNGSVVALTLNRDRPLWNYTRIGFDCVSRSLATGRFLLRKTPGIVVDFKNKKHGYVETVLLDPLTGSFEAVASNSSSTFDAGAIVLSLSGPSQDKLIKWTIFGDDRIRLTAIGYPWRDPEDATTLFETKEKGLPKIEKFGRLRGTQRSEYVESNRFVTEKTELLKMHEFNRRFTGSLYVDADDAKLMFATNDEQANVVVHKLGLTCSCTDVDEKSRPLHCAYFSKTQNWPSFQGRKGDGYR